MLTAVITVAVTRHVLEVESCGLLAPLFCGLIFGAGLLISGMVQPTRSLPSWIFSVRGTRPCRGDAAALAVAIPGFRLADRGARPWFCRRVFPAGKSGIDLPLVAGAALFGIGWGVVGFMPGPALESLATLSPGIIVSSSRWPQECYFTTPGNSRG